MKIKTGRLVLCVNSFLDSEYRDIPPLEAAKEVGVTWEGAEVIPMADRWILYEAQYEVGTLPDWIRQTH